VSRAKKGARFMPFRMYLGTNRLNFVLLGKFCFFLLLISEQKIEVLSNLTLPGFNSSRKSLSYQTDM